MISRPGSKFVAFEKFDFLKNFSFQTALRNHVESLGRTLLENMAEVRLVVVAIVVLEIMVVVVGSWGENIQTELNWEWRWELGIIWGQGTKCSMFKTICNGIISGLSHSSKRLYKLIL